MPLVSVVITCYNYADFISEAIESVIGQKYKNIELIIINDGSTDRSLEVIKSYRDKYKFRLVDRANKGIVYTRNEAIRLSSGDFLLFLDADDTVGPNYIEHLVSVALKKNLDVVYCDAHFFSIKEGDMTDSLNPPEFDIERLKNGNFIHMSSLIRVSAIKNTKFDLKTEKITHEDWDFFLNLALNGRKFGKASEPYLNYRVKPLSRSDLLGSEVDLARLYSFIYSKYTKNYPDDMGYLAYGKFADSTIRYSRDLDDANAKIQEDAEAIAKLRYELESIINSKSYRLYHRLISPLRRLMRDTTPDVK